LRWRISFTASAKQWRATNAGHLSLGRDRLHRRGRRERRTSTQRHLPGCGWLGLELDEEANRQHQTRISTTSSRVVAYVIKTDENPMITGHARANVGG
jgi:hypothetical protein